MKLRSTVLSIFILAILLGGIGVTMAIGAWSTVTSRVPAVYTEGEAAGEYNPADIRGSYTLGDVSDLFKIPMADLVKAFGIEGEANPEAYSIKNFEDQFASLAEAGFEIGTSSVRLFVALYRGLPFDLSTDIYLPQPAVTLLEQKGSLTDEQRAYLQAHAVSMPPAGAEVDGEPTASSAVGEQTAPSAPTGETTSSEETLVKGKTTFGELIGWGLSEETVAKILGKDMPGAGVKVKDFCTAEGLDFETIKTELQAEIDQLP